MNDRVWVALDVPSQAAGQRIDHYLMSWFEVATEPALRSISRSYLHKLLGQGRVLVNGEATKRAYRLQGHEHIELRVPEPEPVELCPVAMSLQVLYEDSDLIAVAKPAGLVVHPGAGVTEPTLVHGLLAHCRDLSGIGGELRPGIVHRLDRGTSGVIVAAKHDRAHEALSKAFSERRVVKEYDAFVFGVPVPAEERIESLYGRHPRHRKRFSSRVTRGKVAVTTYRLVKAKDGVSRLDILLGTGRTHQIRVHLADRGHPILGDVDYGGHRLNRISDSRLRDLAADFDHQALHARRLQIPHPVHGGLLELRAPLPADLKRLDAALDPTEPQS